MHAKAMQAKTVTLSDGRTLAYAEFGDPAGYPLIWCHGNPGSRREPNLLDPTLLARLRVHAIVPDRPGIGLSTHRAKRRLMDWPIDVAALAAMLELERFALLGVSTGAAYALACARAMPHRITRAGIVSGMGPMGVLEQLAREGRAVAVSQYFKLARRSFLLHRGMVWLMRQSLHQPDKMMAQVMATLPPADQAILNEPRTRQAFLSLLYDALHPGTSGLAWDMVAAAQPWGFDLREIMLPIYWWHGGADRNVPVAWGTAVAEQLPNSFLHVYPGEGHFSLAIHHMEAILQQLIVPHDFVVGQ